MVFEKRQEVQPENVLLGDNAPVEVLFVDMEARERRRDFLHGLMTGAVVAIALCLEASSGVKHITLSRMR